MRICDDGVRFNGRWIFEGFIRVVARSWISAIDVVQVATGFPQAKVEAMAREKLPGHVRHDVNEDGSPFVDFQGYVQLLDNLGTLSVAFTRLAAGRIIKRFCDDADRFEEIDEQIGEIDGRNQKDEDYPRYACRVLGDDEAMQTTCECCEAGPWTTRFEVREHFSRKTHVTKALAEEKRRMKQERRRVLALPTAGAVTPAPPHVEAPRSMTLLEFLMERFTDEQQRLFATTYSVFMQKDKRQTFCIDLDEAFPWVGYTRKSNAVRKLQDVLQRDIDYISHGAQNGAPDRCFDTNVKYLIKPKAFEVFLMSAGTPQGKQARRYFVELEWAIHEWIERENAAKLRVAQSNQRTQRPQNPSYVPLITMPRMQAATDNEEVLGPQVYTLQPGGNLRLPPGVVPEGATVLKAGNTAKEVNRGMCHAPTYGEFEWIDHLACPTPQLLEDTLFAHMKMHGRHVIGQRPDGTLDTELFWVQNHEMYKRDMEYIVRRRDDHVAQLTHTETARLQVLNSRAQVEVEQVRERTQAHKTEEAKFQVRLAEIELERDIHRTKQLQITASLHLNDAH